MWRIESISLRSQAENKILSKKPRQFYNTDVYSNKAIKTEPLKKKSKQIETTIDEEVAMVFSSSNLILCPPFSTETQVKKIPPLS